MIILEKKFQMAVLHLNSSFRNCLAIS